MNDGSAQRLILAIETSGPGGGVALLRGQEILGEAAFSEQRRQAAELVPQMRSLLEAAGVDRGQIAAVAVSIGPGSYTGLRIGLSAAKTFCWATGIALAPVCSLEALAHDALDRYPDAVAAAAGRIFACRDAYGGQVYVREFRRIDGGALAAQTSCEVLAPQALLEKMDPPALVLGSGCAPLRQLGPVPAGLALQGAPETARALTVGRLAAADPSGERKGRDVHDLAPVYLRKSGAEVLRERRAAEPSAS